jgi:hypothetical protein
LGLRWDPAGFLGGRRRLGALVPSLLGPAAARSGSAARWGAAARSRRGVPARAARNRRRESDPTPFWGVPGGDPAANPTPNTQRPTPNAQATQRPTPNARPQLALGCTYRDADYTVVKCSIGASKRAIEVPVKWPRRQPNAPGVTLPRTQRPTSNAQATQRPKNEPLRIATPT